MQNHFDLFQLTQRFDIDTAELDAAFREIQARVHPDKFVSASSAEQRIAMQWATRANEAYQTLKNPLKRAAYLCELHGVPLEAESNTAMPAAFLMQQMEWREELDEAKTDVATLARLEAEVQQARRLQLQTIAEQLGQADYQLAAQSIRQLMFLDKFDADLAHLSDQSA
ncbi:molecular chaperone HscB [Oxalobacteraceae bacterium GrIS 1.18]